jgi:RES domain-containing protein
MKIFRIEREKHLKDVLKGIGASLSNENRWNSIGTNLVYTAENRSLAILEILVHLDLKNELPNDRVLIEIDIPIKSNILTFNPKEIDLKNKNITKRLGDNFIKENQFLLLKVPSIITPFEYNYLLNPYHQLVEKIKINKITPLKIDERLVY